MKNENKTVVFRRALTAKELHKLKIVVDTENISRACIYAGISQPTWRRIYTHGGVTKTNTIQSLMEYADTVKRVVNKELNK